MNDKDKTQCSEVIDSFLDGTCSDDVWDDFISVKSNDTTVRMIKKFCAESSFIYLSGDKTQWCSNEGKAKLSVLSDLIRNHTEVAIKLFIKTEIMNYNNSLRGLASREAKGSVERR